MGTGLVTRPARPTVSVRPRSTSRRGGAPPLGPRLAGVVALLALFVGALAWRMVDLQVVRPEHMVQFGVDQRLDVLEVPVDRGTIFDRNGNELAVTVSRRTVAADPSLIGDPERVASELAPILGRSVTELTALLQRDGRFAYLARRVDDRIADRVAQQNLPGVFLVDEPERSRPAGDLARSVVGVVGSENIGLSGLELQYDGPLSGAAGEVHLERDASGRRIPTGSFWEQPADGGDGLVLTIDRSLQYQTEQALRAAVEVTRAKGGMAILSDPRTGDLLAIANLARGEPTGDALGEIVATGNNMAVTTVFEPGSVNKVITVAAALEEGVAEPDTVLEVPDELPVADHTFSDHDPHETKRWSVNDIVTNSSNVGTIMLAQRLGAERVDRYLHRFGFGERTALEFPNESAGLMLDLDDWSGTSIGAIPIGQGIAVTALQMLSVYNTLANEGVAQPPRLVAGRTDEDGSMRDAPLAEGHRVVSAATARQLRAMLTAVVDSGTGGAAAIDGYAVAGKTGTARKPQDTGGYADAEGNFHYVATFAGFVPADDPQLSAIVVLDEPQTSIYAAETAAPVFAEISRFALHSLRIPPADIGFADVGVPQLSPGVGGPTANEVSGAAASPPTSG